MAERPTSIDPYVPERGDDGYDVTGYDLILDYAVSSNRLDGRAAIRLVPRRPASRIVLDLVGLRASRVAVAGRAARWQHRGGKLHILPATSLDAGVEVVVEVRYAGNPAPTGSRWGGVGWEELTDGVLVAAQPSGACTWFPCNDLASQKAPFRVTFTAASAYRVVANGLLRTRRVGGSTTTWEYEQPEPTSPYLMTVHVGRYEEHEVTSAPVPMWAVLGSSERTAFASAFARQAEMMDVFVERFGPYPFAAGYTVVICPEPLEMPLEAQGQAIFGTNHLTGDDERLIAHELAHQWFGNSLTAAGWHDIWLHEGFACYAEWLWSEASGGLSADDQARRHHGRLQALPQDLLLADPGPDDMFDDRVYKRGALTLHSLRLELGDVPFFALLRTWAADHQHGLVATPDLEALVADVAGRPLTALFDAWLRSPALPPLPSS